METTNLAQPFALPLKRRITNLTGRNFFSSPSSMEFFFQKFKTPANDGNVAL